ncbi:MAG: hypothetical protein CMJ67_03090 [Planctomycetaceae bacterium]|nr:hypothetical protein [Planctomycetaceae bacterium]
MHLPIRIADAMTLANATASTWPATVMMWFHSPWKSLVIESAARSGMDRHRRESEQHHYALPIPM